MHAISIRGPISDYVVRQEGANIVAAFTLDGERLVLRMEPPEAVALGVILQETAQAALFGATAKSRAA